LQRKPNCCCSICKTKIYRRPSQIKNGQVFCSIQCSAVSQQKQKSCPVCSALFIGAKKTCSRTCANVSRTGLSYTKENSHNKAYRGKYLKEMLAVRNKGKCERCHHANYAILQVHHKIERHRGGTDAASNLELLCPNCHATHHLGKSLYKIQKMV
jgi:5-methylcytosine-specific restriction endonuclease McrA